MTMNRVIHGAVRRDLARLAAALDDVRDGDRARAGELRRAYDQLHAQLAHHHHGEDTHVWPWLATTGADPALLEAMHGEHAGMSAALIASSAAMAAYADTGSAAAAAAARESLRRTTEVVERHLRHEEDELEPVLVPHLGTAGWKAVEKKLSRQPPVVAGMFFAWVTDGMGAAERAYLRSEVPAPVVAVLSRVFGRRYHREVAPVWRR